MPASKRGDFFGNLKKVATPGPQRTGSDDAYFDWLVAVGYWDLRDPSFEPSSLFTAKCT